MNMETKMETYPIIFCRWFRSRVCWETTCRSFIHNPEKYQNITEDWDGKKMLVLTWNGNMKKEHAGQLWMDTSRISGTNINTWLLKNRNIHLTNTAQLIIVLHNNYCTSLVMDWEIGRASCRPIALKATRSLLLTDLPTYSKSPIIP